MSGTTFKATRAAFSQLPIGADVGMAANEAPDEHDLIVLNSSGYGVVSDGSEVGARMLGIHNEKRSTSSTTAGLNVVRLWNGYGEDMPQSADANDYFTTGDFLLPAYISGAKEIGKLAVVNGVARPLAGLHLHIDKSGKPVLWLGDVAQLVARGLVIAEDFQFGRYAIADAAATTAISERVIGRVTVHGIVDEVKYTGSAFAADNSDYATGTIAKRSAADNYASATTIATFDSRAANQGAATAFTPYAWRLEAAANLRLVPGDVLTLVTTKAASGKSLVGVIDVVGKVI